MVGHLLLLGCSAGHAPRNTNGMCPDSLLTDDMVTGDVKLGDSGAMHGCCLLNKAVETMELIFDLHACSIRNEVHQMTLGSRDTVLTSRFKILGTYTPALQHTC